MKFGVATFSRVWDPELEHFTKFRLKIVKSGRLHANFALLGVVLMVFTFPQPLRYHLPMTTATNRWPLTSFKLPWCQETLVASEGSNDFGVLIKRTDSMELLDRKTR